jgi:hypothetical protein
MPGRGTWASLAGQALPSVYQSGRILAPPGHRHLGEEAAMVFLALAIFVALFGWGAQYFGWHDPMGKVQLALFTSFILGMVCGYKSQS